MPLQTKLITHLLSVTFTKAHACPASMANGPRPVANHRANGRSPPMGVSKGSMVVPGLARKGTVVMRCCNKYKACERC